MSHSDPTLKTWHWGKLIMAVTIQKTTARMPSYPWSDRLLLFKAVGFSSPFQKKKRTAWLLLGIVTCLPFSSLCQLYLVAKWAVLNEAMDTGNSAQRAALNETWRRRGISFRLHSYIKKHSGAECSFNNDPNKYAQFDVAVGAFDPNKRSTYFILVKLL